VASAPVGVLAARVAPLNSDQPASIVGSLFIDGNDGGTDKLAATGASGGVANIVTSLAFIACIGAAPAG